VPELSPSLVVNGSDDEPLVLAGPPGQLTGSIHLHNPGDAKVVLRDAGLRDPSGVLQLSSARHALKPVVLRPDQGGSVALSVAVDPTTPPGEYRAELDVGGHSPPVVLHVAEVVDLTVRPRSLVVTNEVGVPQRKRLIVTNDGNVPFTPVSPARVDLLDDVRGDRVQRVAIDALLGAGRPELEALVVALLTISREDPAGSAEVRAAGGQTEVQPGETRAVEIEITLHDEMPPNRRYRGRMPVLTRDVDIVVVAAGALGRAADAVPPAATTPAKPARKRGAKS